MAQSSTSTKFYTELSELELSTREQIQDIKLYDKTTQVVGIIKIVKSRATSADGKTEYMKGVIEAENDLIPFVTFGENIGIHENKLVPGIKCLLSNCYIKPFDRKYDKSVTTDFQIHLMSNTEIKWIESVDKEKRAKEKFEVCDLENVCKHNGLIEIANAYIRSIPTTFKESSTSSIRICSITDGRSSFEVRFLCEHINEVNIGDPVVIKGLLNENGNPTYIAIQKSENFHKKPDTEALPLAQTITASKAVKRKSDFFDELEPVSKSAKKD